MCRQFVIGCTHFDDASVLRFRKTQFNSLTDMHDKITASWEAQVTDSDIVYILGDFAMQKVDYWAKRLPGNKILILGNHDKMTVHDGPFMSVDRTLFLRIQPKAFNESPVEVFLHHYPCMTWEKRDKGSIHMHAHCHGGIEASLPDHHGPRRIDVSVDCWDAWPIPIETAINAAIKKSKEKSYDSDSC